MTLARAMFEFSLVINPVKLERAVFVKRSFACSYLNMIFRFHFMQGLEGCRFVKRSALIGGTCRGALRSDICRNPS
jgi:hypothetical protein